MILDLPPHVEQSITAKAQAQGQRVQDFILMSAYEKALTFSYASNQETRQAINELSQGLGTKFNTGDDLMADLNCLPSQSNLDKQAYLTHLAG